MRAEAEQRRAVAAPSARPSRPRRRRSVGVVLGNTISVGRNPSRRAAAIRLRRPIGAVAVRSTSRTSQPARRAAARRRARACTGGLVVPRTSSRSWQRPCRVKAMPPTSGGLTSSVLATEHRGAVQPSGGIAAAQRRRGGPPAAARASAPPCSSGGRPERCRSGRSRRRTRRTARRSRPPRASDVVRSPTSTRMNGQKYDLAAERHARVEERIEAAALRARAPGV